MSIRTLIPTLITLLLITLLEIALIQGFEFSNLPINLSGYLPKFSLLFLVNVAIFLMAVVLWRFGIRHLIKKPLLAGLNFRTKLIIALSFMTLVPTVLLLFVSYNLNIESIERWADEKVALALREAVNLTNALEIFHTLPMADIAERIAFDPELIELLERKEDVSERGNALASEEDYIVAIYNSFGNRIFSTMSNQPPLKISDFLPPVEALPDIPTTSDIDVGDEGLFLCAMPISSPAKPVLERSEGSGFSTESDEERLGAVVIGRILPFNRSSIASIRKRVNSLRADIGAGQASYIRSVATKRPAQKAVILVLLLTSALIFCIAFWTSALISKSITNPIDRLIAGTEQVARGNLDYTVDVEGKDEFAFLANSFNRMTEDLKRSTEELRRAEKMAVWQEVAQKLAHEIKNPLTPIQLSAQRLQRRYHSNREGFSAILSQCTQTIVDEVEGLRRLLDEFSKLAKMPAPQLKRVDVRKGIQNAIELFGELSENITIKTEFEAEMPAILADDDQIKRSFFNIIKNAIESMAQQGGSLTIKAYYSRLDKQVVIQFIDTGPGVSPEVLPKLFLPHFSTKKDGMGLGLAIVRKIIDDHGGEIYVDSPSSEEGTIFTIRLPVAS
ncbi:TPA: HAMP domain-containing protein [Candidatus Poribacteria bacterium]|nr:HAMP domain-containing protein [Candidatus Poribacteria bacterium]